MEPEAGTPRPRPKSIWYLLAEYSELAIMMPACAVIGYFIGAGLDAWLHTGRVLSIVFLLLGVAAGVVEMIKVLNRTMRD